MILPPRTDHACLAEITAIVRRRIASRDPELIALAARFRTIRNLVRWIRSLPQHDDDGVDHELPKVLTCRPLQRLWLPSSAPNCVERAALYLALAELIEPGPSRWLSTIEVTDLRGRRVLHTLPIEDEREVVLDPLVPRNAAAAGVDAQQGAAPPSSTAAGAAWLCQLAHEPAQQVPGGERRLRNAASALRAATIDGAAIPAAAIDDVALALTLAEPEAARWGARGVAIVDQVTRAVASSARSEIASDSSTTLRNALVRGIGHYRLPRELARGLRIAAHAAAAVVPALAVPAARLALASAGVTPAMLAPLELALRRDGFSLGPLAPSDA